MREYGLLKLSMIVGLLLFELVLPVSIHHITCIPSPSLITETRELNTPRSNQTIATAAADQSDGHDLCSRHLLKSTPFANNLRQAELSEILTRQNKVILFLDDARFSLVKSIKLTVNLYFAPPEIPSLFAFLTSMVVLLI